MRRFYTFYVTTAANTAEQDFNVTNNIDNYRTQHVKRVYVGTQVAGFSVGFAAAGQKFGAADTTIFAAGNEPLSLEFDVPAKVGLTIYTVDVNGTAHTNVPVVLEYDVDAGSGP